MSSIAGPLGRAFETEKPTGKAIEIGKLEANPLIVLRRLAVLDKNGALDEPAQRKLLEWAERSDLGQKRTLVTPVTRRRTEALDRLRARGHTVIRLRAQPQWRLVVGLGERDNPHEVGITLHGSYGWPIIPGCSLKGLTASWAAKLIGRDSPVYQRIFGAIRQRGSVRFLDALPAGAPVKVVLDVLTPHYQPYYRGEEPPAEYHNPIPVHFLTVTGAFTVDLTGHLARDVEQAAEWLSAAAGELGAGAKTSAGYGYLTLTRLGEEP
jgi:CRISPR-associated protein Cmr6